MPKIHRLDKRQGLHKDLLTRAALTALRILLRTAGKLTGSAKVRLVYFPAQNSFSGKKRQRHRGPTNAKSPALDLSRAGKLLILFDF
jgi:hypothetical protein